jgi:hypothetical protein
VTILFAGDAHGDRLALAGHGERLWIHGGRVQTRRDEILWGYHNEAVTGHTNTETGRRQRLSVQRRRQYAEYDDQRQRQPNE